VKSAPKEVAAKSFILQGDAEPLSSAPVWAEPSQLLLGNWLLSLKGVESHIPITPFLGTWPPKLAYALAATLLCRGQEKHMMRESSAQLGKSGKE
jgi:hypothetical protein